jgi:hypothetical protein
MEGVSCLKRIPIIISIQHKRMPVMFGHIKRIFVDVQDFESDVWLLASSGVYLLRLEHVAPEYRETHNNFLKGVHNSTS